MTDLYLKFASEAEAFGILYDVTAEYRDKDGNLLTANEKGKYPKGAIVTEIKQPKFQNIDVIGDIYKPTGTTTVVEGPNGDQMEVPLMEKLEGYHVNVRTVDGEDTTTIEVFAVLPSSPTRVWA